MSVQVVRLAPHDPLPDGGGHVLVLRRFAEEDPGRTEIEVSVARPGSTHAGHAVLPGHAMERAIRDATELAQADGLPRVYVIDRAAGDRERDVLSHHGDHTVHMDQLSDTDPEDGEQGSDMRAR